MSGKTLRWTNMLVAILAVVALVSCTRQEATPFVTSSQSATAASSDAPRNDLGGPATTESNPPGGTVDRLLQRLRAGNVAYNAPKEMSLGEPTTIEVALSFRMPPEELKQLIEPAGDKVAARIKMSDRMTAHLTGEGFDIAPIDPELQAVSMKDVTRWEWEVKPKKPGKQALHLTISVLLSIDGQPTPKVLESFRADIDVKVGWTERVASFLSDNWRWMWTTILLPVAGWGWHRSRRPRKQPTT